MQGEPHLVEIWLDDQNGVKHGTFQNIGKGEYFMGVLGSTAWVNGIPASLQNFFLN